MPENHGKLLPTGGANGLKILQIAISGNPKRSVKMTMLTRLTQTAIILRFGGLPADLAVITRGMTFHGLNFPGTASG